MKNIKYIFFDIGYTLINEDDAWKYRCIEQSNMEEAKKINLSAKDIYNEIVQASQQYKPQYKTVIKKYGFKNTAPYRDKFEKIYDDAEMVLCKLSQKYKLGIIANQSDGLKNRLNALGILKYFSCIISSFDFQIKKPDTRLFEIAAQKSGCSVSDAVMIGDRLDNDIFPAKKVGMKTIWIKKGFGGMQSPKNDEYNPDMQITDLKELLDIF